MSLQDKIAAYKKGMIKKAPPEALAIIQRATEDLRQSGIVGRAVKVGDQAPDFALPDSGGRSVSLASRIEKGPLVVTFYRGKW
jgi:hypothetical protein